MRLRSLDSGRLFSANTAFRDKPFIHLYSGGFAEPIPSPLRASLRARRSSLSRAPQRAPRPLIPGRGDTPAPARLHLLWRSRAYASHTRLATEKKRSYILLRAKSRQRRRYPLFRIRCSAREGFSSTAAKTPSAPKTSGVLYFVAGCPLIQAQAWHKPSKNPKKTRCGGKPHRARGRSAYS